MIEGENELAGELAQLEAEARADDAPQPAPDQQEANQAGAELTAALMVSMLEKTVCTFWPVLEYSDDDRTALAGRLVPVLLKYEMGLPPWLKPWQEELQLALLLAGTAFASWQQIQAAAELEREQREAAGNGAESTAEAA